jgi:hypothetical protein
MATKAYIAHANHLQGSCKHKSKWAASTKEPQARRVDDTLTYLDDPVVPADAIREAGGVIKYWHQAAALRMSKMGSNFCSTPGMLYTKCTLLTANIVLNLSQHHPLTPNVPSHGKSNSFCFINSVFLFCS